MSQRSLNIGKAEISLSARRRRRRSPRAVVDHFDMIAWRHVCLARTGILMECGAGFVNLGTFEDDFLEVFIRPFFCSTEVLYHDGC
jgi:hypothetical protein